MPFDAGAVVGKAVLNADGWAAGVSAIQKQNQNAINSFNNVKNKALAATAIITTGFVASVKAASDFSKSFANVTTLVDESQVDIQSMRNELLQLDARLGSATDLTDGLYQAISASVAPAEAVTFVGESAKFAKAALVDTNTAVDVITTRLNAYGLAASEAASTSDKLFSVIKLGKTTGAELSAVIGQSIGLAANMGVAFDELGASIAIMTRQGTNASEATTQFNAIINAFLKPSDEMKDIIKKLGFESASLAIKQIGLKKTIDAVIGATDGSNESLAELFQNTRALRGAISLTGEGAADFEKILNEIENSAGATNKAFEKQDLTFETLKNSVNKLAINIGDVLLPSVVGIVEHVSVWFEKLNSLDDQTKKNIVNIGLFVAAIGPGLAIIQKLVLAYKAILPLLLAAKAGFAGQALAVGSSTAATVAHTIATKAAAAAQKLWNIVLAASPFLLVAGGIAAVTAGVVGLVSKIKKTNSELAIMGDTAANTKELMRSLARQIEANDKSLDKFFTTLYNGAAIIDTTINPDNIQKTIDNINEEIKAVDKQTDAIKNQISVIKDRASKRIFVIEGEEKKDAEKIKKLNDELNNMLKARESLVNKLSEAEQIRASKEIEKQNELIEAKKVKAEEEKRILEQKKAEEEKARIEREAAEIAEAQRTEERNRKILANRIAHSELINEIRKRDVEKEKERQEKLQLEIEKTASQIMTTFAPVLTELGAALTGAEDGWANVKKAALNSLAAIVRAFGEQLTVQSIAAFVAGNVPLGVGYAAAATGAFASAGIIQGLKKGGVANGLTLVGEEGPELINVGTPSRVYPANETQQMLTPEINMNITNIINSDIDVDIINRKLGRTLENVLRKI